jgi:hypothetical protein
MAKALHDEIKNEPFAVNCSGPNGCRLDGFYVNAYSVWDTSLRKQVATAQTVEEAFYWASMIGATTIWHGDVLLATRDKKGGVTFHNGYCNILETKKE